MVISAPCFSSNLTCHFIKSIIHLVFWTNFYHLLLHLFILLQHRRFVCYPCGMYFQYYEIIALNSKESVNEKKRGGGNCCGSTMNLGGREKSMCQSINVFEVTSSHRDYRAVNNDNWKYLLSHTLNKAFSLFPGWGWPNHTTSFSHALWGAA